MAWARNAGATPSARTDLHGTFVHSELNHAALAFSQLPASRAGAFFAENGSILDVAMTQVSFPSQGDLAMHEVVRSGPYGMQKLQKCMKISGWSFAFRNLSLFLSVCSVYADEGISEIAPMFDSIISMELMCYLSTGISPFIISAPLDGMHRCILRRPNQGTITSSRDSRLTTN